MTRDWLHLESMLKRLEFQIRNLSKYIISARRGNYKGGASVRSYTLRIFDTAAPVSVKVNGNTAVSYVYDKDKRCTTVEVPAIKCSTGVKVEVIYSFE